MKHRWLLLALGASLSMGAQAKQDKDHKEHQHKSHHEHKADSHSKSLPHGLEKKVARGEPLPPGWQKKYQRGDVLEQDIYDRGVIVGPVGVDGAITIRIDNTLFKLHDKTRRILDIIDE